MLQSVSKHDRTTSAGGAPKFIPFGQNLNSTVLRKGTITVNALLCECTKNLLEL